MYRAGSLTLCLSSCLYCCVLPLLLAGCNSGSDGGGGGGGPAQEPAEDPPAGNVVSGTVTKDTFLPGGEVVGTTFPFARELFRSTIGDNGHFEKTLEVETETVIKIAATGTFVSESTLLEETTGAFPLSALFIARPNQSGAANVTPVSTLIGERVRHLCAARPDLTIPEKLERARAEYAALLGVTDLDVVPAPTTGDALKLWLVGAGFTEVAMARGLTATDVIARYAAAWRDGITAPTTKDDEATETPQQIYPSMKWSVFLPCGGRLSSSLKREKANWA